MGQVALQFFRAYELFVERERVREDVETQYDILLAVIRPEAFKKKHTKKEESSEGDFVTDRESFLREMENLRAEAAENSDNDSSGGWN